MTTLRTDYLPATPEFSDWETIIREGITTAEDRLHVVIEWPQGAKSPAVTLHLDGCTYPDGTPIWDNPLIGHGGHVVATRADGEGVTVYTEDGHTWEDLAVHLDRLMDGWAESVMITLTELKAADDAVRDLEREMRDARARRAEWAKRAQARGVTQYRIAKTVGRPEQSASLWLK